MTRDVAFRSLIVLAVASSIALIAGIMKLTGVRKARPTQLQLI